ncbi:MAG: hypothetical protein J7623_22295 [Chitinophaga sp.]|uniref:hypothetical protein n=1 Tax=Chitinophaga sp. TaxID=1869181 RepID=UPI001B2CE2AF|nr:hypothetical protein [Chitinophaga sp.]MBO9731387.1 hypothetical protein [Chitinophaga sp.]
MRKTLFIVAAIGAIFWACNKKEAAHPSNDESETKLIDEAFDYFTATINSATDKIHRPDKFPLWGGANVTQDINGSVVTVTADAKTLPGGYYPNAYSRIILSNTLQRD